MDILLDSALATRGEAVRMGLIISIDGRAGSSYQDERFRRRERRVAAVMVCLQVGSFLYVDRLRLGVKLRDMCRALKQTSPYANSTVKR